MKIAVVGAGIAGLAAAARLQNAGHEVDVFEHRNYAGGKLTEIMVGDYRFDAGPSIFTMPEYVDEIFKVCGKNPKDYFEYEFMDGICNYFWEDGTQLTSYADPERFAKEIEDKLKVDSQPVRKMMSKNQFKFETVGDLFIRKSLHKLGTYTSYNTVRAIARTPRLQLFQSMDQVNNKLLNHPKLVQMFNRFATYNGSNPYEASSILNLIGHLELGLGIALPKNGMHDISQSIYKLAKDLGVKFHFGRKVDEILLKNKQASGIRLGEDKFSYDKVVCNMDVYYAYNKLLPNEPQPIKVLNQTRSSSGIVFYWGIKKEFPELILHNALMTNDSEKEFDCIFNKKTITDDPTIYINITSKHCPEDAPKGCENWFAMINVPHIQGQDWDKIIEQARERIIQKSSRMLGTDIGSLIEAEEVFEPRIIQNRTFSYQGSLYGISSNSTTGAFFRHANFSRKIKDLYFCGGSVHPGGGIPMCLSSAKIVADIITA
ncbi:MAG: phytoene desaturase family protein [Saprospiraceae bacterium]|nr:phytoene desaturase family protein [Saprospiraceae bacterium]